VRRPDEAVTNSARGTRAISAPGAIGVVVVTPRSVLPGAKRVSAIDGSRPPRRSIQRRSSLGNGASAALRLLLGRRRSPPAAWRPRRPPCGDVYAAASETKSGRRQYARRRIWKARRGLLKGEGGQTRKRIRNKRRKTVAL